MPPPESGPDSVSVVVPVKNYGRYLAECLDSTLEQTHPPDEVIVIDDHSDDESFELAQNYAPAVRALVSEGTGAAAARNTGIRQASGDLIAFLDADDRWLPRALDDLLDALTADRSALLAVGCIREFVSPELVPEERARFSPREGDAETTMIVAMLAHRSVFETVGTFDEQLAVGETIDWLARCHDAGIGLARTPRVVTERRLHPAQLSRPRSDYLTVIRSVLARRHR